jgi:hypothetical protein
MGSQLKKLSIQDCQIVWDKKNLIPEEDMQAIREDIRSMSTEIQEAIEFTKRLRMKGREIEVKFWFNKDMTKDCFLIVYYEPSCEAWAMLVVDKSDKVIGEIECADPLTFGFIEKDEILRKESIE